MIPNARAGDFALDAAIRLDRDQRAAKGVTQMDDISKPSVAIIGCGLIGALWDTPGQPYSLTHVVKTCRVGVSALRC